MDGGITVRPQLRQLQPTRGYLFERNNKICCGSSESRKEAHSGKHKLKWDEWIYIRVNLGSFDPPD
jgi:hypothetical protein